MARVRTKVEELAENRVRLQVEVPSDHMKHAVEHASSDLAATTKIPGFRKGKVPQKVLEARSGATSIFSEAVESHISGWFWNAAEDASIRPVSQPELELRPADLRGRAVQLHRRVRGPAAAGGGRLGGLEVPAPEPDVPEELVERELEALRASVAELVPVEDRPAKDGDVMVVDLVDETGEAQRDYVVQLGAGRLVEDIERGLRGMSPGETKTIAYTDTEKRRSRPRRPSRSSRSRSCRRSTTSWPAPRASSRRSRSCAPRSSSACARRSRPSSTRTSAPPRSTSSSRRRTSTSPTRSSSRAPPSC